MRRGRLVVFAKQPVPGRVKTRMSPPLSDEDAAELYARMLDDVLAASAVAVERFGLEGVLAVDPPGAVDALARRAPPAFRCVAQRGAGLAARMTRALSEAGAADAWPALLRGSDSPALAPEAIGAALDALREVDLVLIPDLDGGYSLVGVRRPAQGLFAHAMSTGRVAEDTLAAAARAGLSARSLAASFDLDTVADLRWLAEARLRGAGHLCRRTLAFLDERDLWRHVSPPAQPAGSG